MLKMAESTKPLLVTKYIKSAKTFNKQVQKSLGILKTLRMTGIQILQKSQELSATFCVGLLRTQTDTARFLPLYNHFH